MERSQSVTASIAVLGDVVFISLLLTWPELLATAKASRALAAGIESEDGGDGLHGGRGGKAHDSGSALAA